MQIIIPVSVHNWTGDNFWGVVWGKHHPQQPMGNCSSMIPVRRNGTTKVFSQPGCLPLGLRWGDIPYNSENKPRSLYFSKDLFEGLIFGGAYILRGLSTEGNLRFKIYWASLIVGKKFTVLLCFTLYLSAISKYKPPVGLYFNGGYSCILCYDFGGLYLEGLIHGGAYFWNFTVTHGFSLHMQNHFILWQIQNNCKLNRGTLANGTLETSLRSYLSILDNWALFTDYCSYLTGSRTRVKILFTFFIRQFFNSPFHSHLKRKEWEIQTGDRNK